MRPTQRLAAVSLLGVFLITPPVLAQEPTRCATPRGTSEDLFALDLEALMNSPTRPA